MIAGVADTHTALWYLHKNPLLSPPARESIDAVAIDGDTIVLSPISLAEIVYLTEKKKIPASAYEERKNALADHEYVIEETPFNARVVEAMPDLPDRIVAATAIYFGVPDHDGGDAGVVGGLRGARADGCAGEEQGHERGVKEAAHDGQSYTSLGGCNPARVPLPSPTY